MTPKAKLLMLVNNVGAAREALGGVPSSMFWNAAYGKVIDAEGALAEYLESLDVAEKPAKGIGGLTGTFY